MSISAEEQTRINNLAAWQEDHMKEIVDQIVSRTDEEIEEIVRENIR